MENYEQKYKQALERAKQAINNIPDKALAEWLQSIFPELKESNDNKIKTNITKLLRFVRDTHHQYSNECTEAIDWLKKQGEQRPVVKGKLKFEVGNWIVNNDDGYICQITAIRDDEYCLWPLDSEVEGFLRITDVDNDYHLWTIQDAQDGDILTTRLSSEGDWIGIFKERTGESFTTHCFLASDDKFVTNINLCKQHGTHGIHPVTEEQRGLLFRKIKEAGYEWNTEKKELKKVGQKPVEWSKEDEKYYYAALWYIENSCGMRGCVYNWLKSIKSRLKGKEI